MERHIQDGLVHKIGYDYSKQLWGLKYVTYSSSITSKSGAVCKYQ